MVRVFNKENDVLEEFEKDNKKLYESAWKSQFFSGMMMPIMQFVGNLGYVMVALLRWRVCYQRFALKLVISSPSSSISVTLHSQSSRSLRLQTCLQSSAAASERVFEFLDEEEEVQQPRKSGYLSKDSTEMYSLSM